MESHKVFLIGKIQSLLEIKESHDFISYNYTAEDGEKNIVHEKYKYNIIQYTGLEARFGGYTKAIMHHFDNTNDAVILCYYADNFLTLERTIQFFNEDFIPKTSEFGYKKINIAALVGITDSNYPHEQKSESYRQVTIQEATDAVAKIQKFSTIEVKHISSLIDKEGWFTDGTVLQHLSTQISAIKLLSTKQQSGCMLM